MKLKKRATASSDSARESFPPSPYAVHGASVCRAHTRNVTRTSLILLLHRGMRAGCEAFGFSSLQTPGNVSELMKLIGAHTFFFYYITLFYLFMNFMLECKFIHA